MILAAQLPFVDGTVLFRVVVMITRSTIVPDSNRITVKLAASMASVPSASRHSIELAANAINANPVSMIVFNRELFIKYYPYENILFE